MKYRSAHILLGLFALIIAMPKVMAQHTYSEGCLLSKAAFNAPHFYCECMEYAQQFVFPFEEEINDTVWFNATVDDLRQGISAYWFADCSATIEVYAFCTSYIPSFSMTVGANMMCDMDNAQINKKLDEMGEQAALLAKSLVPHVRVYPNKKGGSGKVYCYPYNQGPLSICEDPLPLQSGMVYVCDQPENVYRMEWSQIHSEGKAFIHWKQKKNLPCEIWLTLDSCTGEEIGRAQLSDSLHIYRPDSALLKEVRAQKRSVWMHVRHAENMTGRVAWYNNPYFMEEKLPTLEQSICLGKTLTVNHQAFKTDTAFTDTLWVIKDTLQMVDIRLTFEQPQLEYDTVRVRASVLPGGYRYKPSGTILYEFGDTIVEILRNEECTRRILLTVEEDTTDPEGTEEVEAGEARAYKYIRDGQLFILIDDRKYNVFGQQTK